MDQQTVFHYDKHAVELVRRYESADVSHIRHSMIRHLEGKKVLQIGCGSGRDASFLLDSGFDVRAVDASAAMADEATRLHPELHGRVSCEALPLAEDSALLREIFHAVVATAVFMNIPEERLFEAAFQNKRMLSSGGVLLIWTSPGRQGLTDHRDRGGRLLLERSPDGLRLLFERLGFDIVAGVHHGGLARPDADTTRST